MANILDDWLGVAVMIDGIATELNDRTKTVLRAGFAEGVWDVMDVPSMALEEPALKTKVALWMAILADSAAAIIPAPLVPAGDKLRLEGWLRTRYQVVGVSAATPVMAALSAECAADLLAQGMDGAMGGIGALKGLELSIYLGRACAADETVGGAYAQPPHSMAGAVASAKASKGLGGVKTVDVLLMDARKSGDKAPILRHFNDLCYRLSNSNSHPYNSKGANQIQTFVNKSTANIRDDLAWVIYHQDWRVKYMGRGLPLTSLFDVELAMSAKEQAEELRAKGLGPAGVRYGTLDALPKGRGGSEASSIGPSVSQAGTDMSSALSVLAVTMKDISGAVASISTRLSDLEGANGTPPGKPRKCWHCQSTSHLSDECQSDKAKESRRKKAEKDLKKDE